MVIRMVRIPPIICLPFMALLLSGCESLGLPDQGFVTRSVGGPFGGVFRDTFEPSTGFDGSPNSAAASPQDQTAPRLDECERAARNRASDIAQQGFDGETQTAVYNATLKDCRKYR